MISLLSKYFWDTSGPASGYWVHINFFALLFIENAKNKTITEPPVQYSKLSTSKSKGSLDLSTEKELKEVTKNRFSVFPALVKTFGVSFFLGAFMQIIVAG